MEEFEACLIVEPIFKYYPAGLIIEKSGATRVKHLSGYRHHILGAASLFNLSDTDSTSTDGFKARI